MLTTEDRRPNVVLVVTDDQGFGDVGCHGNPTLETPQMDRLHDESVRLTDFHVSPTCAPTRAALMTGRYNNRTGVWHTIMGRSLLGQDETTMAEIFAESGYRTGIFGKWHLGDNYPFRPQDRGFDNSLIHGGGGIAQTPDYWGNNYFNDTYSRNGEFEDAEGYCTDVWFDEALNFIESNAEQDRPFFCYVPTNAAHGPREVPDEYLQQYIDDVPEDVARFYGMITNIDDNLGRLRDRLDELEIDEETIVVFMGDNGSACAHYNAGMRGQKGSAYEGGHRVPSFIHWPDRIEDETVDTLAAGYDLLPTLADLCGIDTPDIEFDGRSLRPVLEGADTTPPDRTLFVDSQRVEWPEKWKDSAVMTDRWRLIRGEELYDLETDPGQEEDIADEHPDVVSELRQRYEDWWDDIGPFEGYSRIVVGTEEEDPVDLTCHDWHGCETVPWNQGNILEGDAANGFWALEVADPGEYEIELRRWPPESDAPINGVPTDITEIDYGSSGGIWTARAKTVDPDTAGIQIDQTERTRPVSDGDKVVTFSIDLSGGPTKLRSWFENDGDERGAYFASVSKA